MCLTNKADIFVDTKFLLTTLLWFEFDCANSFSFYINSISIDNLINIEIRNNQHNILKNIRFCGVCNILQILGNWSFEFNDRQIYLSTFITLRRPRGIVAQASTQPNRI